MTTWALIFTVAVTAQANPEQNVGQVVGGVGSVSVSNEAGATRGGTIATALQAGDTLTTGPGASSLVSLRSKVSVYVGAQTQLRLQTPAMGLQLVQARGEIRVVSNNNDGVTILTPAVEARLKRGILRVGITSAGTRFCAEKGTVELTSREQQAARQRRSFIQLVKFSAEDQNAPTITLKEGQQILYVPGKGFQAPQDCDPKDWTIDPQQMLVAIGQARSQATRSADATNQNTDQGDGTSSNGLNSQASTTAGVNFSLGNTLASTAASSGGGLFTDANQNTLSGQLKPKFLGVDEDFFRGQAKDTAFPGNIHLVTGEQTYTFNDVTLSPTESITAPQVSKEYWSIGLGALPAGQIVTGIGTGTSASPDAIRIPQFDAFVVRLDQYGIADPASSAAVANQDFAVTGLAGNAPFNPEIVGATPLTDSRGPNQINDRATFALGELSVSQQGSNPQIGMRRSDQDRKIVKDPNGNDNLDQVTPNADVTAFNDVADPRFFTQVPTIKVPTSGPNALSNIPRFSTADNLRRAAFTTLTAEKLSGFANRTGQTRFVIDGRIVDITGYRGR